MLLRLSVEEGATELKRRNFGLKLRCCDARFTFAANDDVKGHQVATGNGVARDNKTSLI